jgi:hypothetical protein
MACDLLIPRHPTLPYSVVIARTAALAIAAALTAAGRRRSMERHCGACSCGSVDGGGTPPLRGASLRRLQLRQRRRRRDAAAPWSATAALAIAARLTVAGRRRSSTFTRPGDRRPSRCP